MHDKPTKLFTKCLNIWKISIKHKYRADEIPNSLKLKLEYKLTNKFLHEIMTMKHFDGKRIIFMEPYQE